MTVQELIEALEQIKDKNKEVKDGNTMESISYIYESEIDNCIYL